MSEETEKVYYKLEKVIGICYKLRDNKLDIVTLNLPDIELI